MTQVRVAGWALDLTSARGTGIDAVRVTATPAAGGAAIVLGTAAYGDVRPDVASIHGPQFGPSAFGLGVNGLPSGTYDLTVWVRRAGTRTFADSATVQVVIK